MDYPAHKNKNGANSVYEIPTEGGGVLSRYTNSTKGRRCICDHRMGWIGHICIRLVGFVFERFDWELPMDIVVEPMIVTIDEPPDDEEDSYYCYHSVHYLTMEQGGPMAMAYNIDKKCRLFINFCMHDTSDVTTKCMVKALIFIPLFQSQNQ